MSSIKFTSRRGTVESNPIASNPARLDPAIRVFFLPPGGSRCRRGETKTALGNGAEPSQSRERETAGREEEDSQFTGGGAEELNCLIPRATQPAPPRISSPLFSAAADLWT
jgi:hypothetical protein